jgi:hypothetical protein
MLNLPSGLSKEQRMSTDLEIHLNDYLNFVLNRDISSKHHHLLLACMPKSGSTWLATMLACLPGFRPGILVNGYDRREQELSEVQLLLNRHSNYVAQMHVRYSEPTAQLIRRFSLKPIVLVRNIFDIVPSIRDHWHCESVRGPACYLKNEMTKWSSDRAEEFIVNMGMPWYFNFFLSWTECESKLLLTYEEMSQSPHHVLEKICHYYSIFVTPSQIDDAVLAADVSNATRRNKAEVGRGATISAAAAQKILEMASYYPGVDFSPIGIAMKTDGAIDDTFIVSGRIRTNSEIQLRPPLDDSTSLPEMTSKTSRELAQSY